MASTTDPRGASFNSDEFRDAIRFAMNMGLPENEDERIIFKWNVVKTYDNPDPAGKPYFWNQSSDTTTTHADVSVPAAVEFFHNKSSGKAGTPFGEIDSPYIIATLLDEDYENVRGAEIIEIDGSTYMVNFVAPPMGLFDTTIYQIFATAEDET